MTTTVQVPHLFPHPCALIRKKRLLELVPFSKTTLHAKLTKGGRFEDASFPRPIYSPHSRTPFWRESEILAWIEACTVSSRTCETGEGKGKATLQCAEDVRSVPATAGKRQAQARESGERRSEDTTGEVPSERHKRVETSIGGRSVVLAVRKQRTFLAPHAKSRVQGA